MDPRRSLTHWARRSAVQPARGEKGKRWGGLTRTARCRTTARGRGAGWRSYSARACHAQAAVSGALYVACASGLAPRFFFRRRRDVEPASSVFLLV